MDSAAGVNMPLLFFSLSREPFRVALAIIPVSVLNVLAHCLAVPADIPSWASTS